MKANLNYRQSFNENRSFTIGSIAPALMLSDKWKNVHELELNSVAIRKADDGLYDYRVAPIDAGGQTKYINQWVKVGGSQNRSTEVGIRHQYSFRFRKEKSWSPYLGVSTLYRYDKIKTRPYILEDYQSTMSAGLRRTSVLYNASLSIVPGIQCALGKKIVVDIGVPVDFLDLSIHTQRVYNPNLPPRQQRVWFSDSELIYTKFLHLRAGVGIKI